MTEENTTESTDTTENTTDMGLLASTEVEQETEENTIENVEVADQEQNWDFVPEKFMDEGKPNIEKLVESYTHLEKTGPSVAPEEYNDEKFEELQLSWGEGDEAEAWKDKVLTQFKDNNISQEHFDVLMPLYSEAMQSFAITSGEPVDLAYEKEKFVQDSGSPEVAEQRIIEVTSFSETLSDDIFKYPIHKTAAGIELLHKLAKLETGPSLVNSSPPVADMAELQSKASSIINDPAYGTNTPMGQSLEARIDKISAAIAKQQA